MLLLPPASDRQNPPPTNQNAMLTALAMGIFGVLWAAGKVISSKRF
jgi:hypothetical protein